ncbi:hypothetical protein HXZ94_14195 [Empedobacter falsenii]|uniref:hypothetical protein n=1 Tax=Empedobacter falsenii TaxID=343874 RepID=UPI0025780B91|nr:hypothetical protein [Empedobacter falsenii]MDM1299644.1 hypothetical protein [Empedobacter falsenii]MDM1319437.1 hypothetical protein [Empedobacter falsenii]
MSQINQLFFQEIVDFLTENIQINVDSKNKLDLIAKSYYTYIIHLDKLIDNEIKINEKLLHSNPLSNLTGHHELCIKTLIKLFGEDSSIFESKAKYSKIYFDALIKEKLWNFNSTVLSKTEFDQIAIDKHIPVFFIVDGIKLLQPNYPQDDIKNMLSHIFRGIQMYDDITDIGDDLQEKQFTYIISNTIQYLKNDNHYYPDNQTYTHKAFFALEELCNPQFEFMEEQFSAAKEIALKYNLVKIANWIDAIDTQIKDWKNQIDEIRNV